MFTVTRAAKLSGYNCLTHSSNAFVHVSRRTRARNALPSLDPSATFSPHTYPCKAPTEGVLEMHNRCIRPVVPLSRASLGTDKISKTIEQEDRAIRSLSALFPISTHPHVSTSQFA